MWEGVGDRTETATFWPPLLWPSTLCLSRSPDAQPEALGSTLLGAGFLYCILSATSLDPNSIRVPRGPFGRVWLSLPHLVYNSVRSLTQLTWLLSWLNYIIVQRPLSRPLDLWNRMFDRHQADITVMQFIGHSLPVHQSMSVPWEFFFTLSHFVSQFPPTPLECATSFRCITLNGIFGRVEAQNTTVVLAEHKVKIKEIEKVNKYTNLARE